MKHLLLFLLLPLSLISQVQFDDLMEINSLNDFKKVVIENNYTATRDQPFSSFLFYGKGGEVLKTMIGIVIVPPMILQTAPSVSVLNWTIIAFFRALPFPLKNIHAAHIFR